MARRGNHGGNGTDEDVCVVVDSFVEDNVRLHAKDDCRFLKETMLGAPGMLAFVCACKHNLDGVKLARVGEGGGEEGGKGIGCSTQPCLCQLMINGVWLHKMTGRVLYVSVA